MDQKEFDERASRLQEVGKFIEKLPAEIWGGAFELLKGYVSQQAATSANSFANQQKDGGDEASIFSRFDHDRPSDNVRLIAAHFFQEYGSEPFSVEEVKAVAADAGITIPDRVDMTIAQAKDSGKQLFTRAGRGKFKTTVHGEAYLKSTYNVKKGTKNRDVDDK